MESRLIAYLNHNVGEKAWFAISGGLIAGEIEEYDPEAGDFGLIGAIYFTGNTVIGLGDTYVLASHVSAWGDGIPPFNT